MSASAVFSFVCLVYFRTAISCINTEKSKSNSMIHFVLCKMDPWKNTPFGSITKIIPNDMHGKGFSQKINITHLKPSNALFSLYQFFVLSISRQCTAVRQGLYVFETDLSTPLNHLQIIKVMHWAFKSILNPPIHQQYSNLG